MLLAGARSAEAAEYLGTRDTVLIPAGSLEQHGNAAPLACDTIIPVRLCAAAGMKTGVAVTPALTFGMSEVHMGFPGTVSLRPGTLSAVARDVTVSLYTHGFRKIVFISGHGGNRGPLTDGMHDAARECPDADLRYLLYCDLPGAAERERELFGSDSGLHVTATEVSMVWHLMGEKMPDFERVRFPPAPPAGSVLSSRKWMEAYPGGGAGSDLECVSEEKGRIFFDFLVARLCSLVEELEGMSAGRECT